MVIGKRRLQDLQAEVDSLRDKMRANKVLLDHARREELTDGALHRALRAAVETERRLAEDEWALEWDPDWEEFIHDPEYGSLVHELAWELLMRVLAKQRPTSLEEAERHVREIAEEFGFDTLRRNADELDEALRRDWPDEIVEEYERVEMESHGYGARTELDEEYLQSIEQRGATSPHAVVDLQREMSERFPPPPFGSGPPESVEELKKLVRARAEELGLGPGDVGVLGSWAENIGPSMIAAWEPRPWSR